MEEPGRLQSMGSLESDTTELLHFHFHFHVLEKEMATHSSVLAWESQGQGSLVGCRLWGPTESDTTKTMQQQQQPVANQENLLTFCQLNIWMDLKNAPLYLCNGIWTSFS